MNRQAIKISDSQSAYHQDIHQIKQRMRQMQQQLKQQASISINIVLALLVLVTLTHFAYISHNQKISQTTAKAIHLKIEKLQLQIGKYQNLFIQASSKIEGAKSLMNEITQYVQIHRQQIHQLQTSVKVVTAQLAALSAKTSAQHEQMKVKSREIEREMQLMDTRSYVQKHASEIVLLKSRGENERDNFEKITNSLSSLFNEVNKIQNINYAQDKKLIDHDATIDTLKGSLKEIENTFNKERNIINAGIKQGRNAWAEVTNVKKLIDKQSQLVQTINKQMSSLKTDVKDLQFNEKTKLDRGIIFLKKISTPIKLNFNNGEYFQTNYKLQDNIVKKTSQHQAIAYSNIEIPRSSISYFQIRIEESLLNLISVGIFTQRKMCKIDCGYCQAEYMYYLYCKNGNIYHGKQLLFDKYKRSKVSEVRKGDVISVFVDQIKRYVIWYVNGMYTESEYIQTGGSLYPFVLMTSRGDEVALIT